MRIGVFYNLPFGGAKRVVSEHVKGLRSQGNPVDVYTINSSGDYFDPSVYATQEYTYEFKNQQLSIPFFGRIYDDFRFFRSLKKLHKKIAADIDRRNYDIVLVHTDSFTQAPFLLRYLKTLNVYYCLEPLRIGYEQMLGIPKNIKGLNRLYETYMRYKRKATDRINAQSAAHTITLSLFGREYMIHAFNLYPKINYLGVDEKKFTPGKIKKKHQILFVAEKEYIYGYDLALEAFKLIPAKLRPELRFVFGTNKTRRISEEELVKLYQESLATLSLSRYDTFGLVPLESMACATPVIALNVGGYRETIINNEVGFLVDFNPQEIADAVMSIVNNPDKALEMGDKARKWIASSWSWKMQVRTLEGLLVSICK
jgi:glycosyltransferase involved in cell wall biosynthesis